MALRRGLRIEHKRSWSSKTWLHSGESLISLRHGGCLPAPSRAIDRGIEAHGNCDRPRSIELSTPIASTIADGGAMDRGSSQERSPGTGRGTEPDRKCDRASSVEASRLMATAIARHSLSDRASSHGGLPAIDRGIASDRTNDCAGSIEGSRRIERTIASDPSTDTFRSRARSPSIVASIHRRHHRNHRV